MSSSDERVLVAILRDRMDFNRLRERLWYRIPIDSAERLLRNRWPPDWLAFYQPKVFGTSAYSVKYYGRVASIRVVPRSELFPSEPFDERARRLYYQIYLHSLEELGQPVVSRRLRRVVFIPTTWEKLISAAEINDLFDDSPLENQLWHHFKAVGIEAERQERVTVAGRRYILDFAIYCRNGQVDVETDGDSYHLNPIKGAADNERNNDLEANGWSVLRFSTAQVRETPANYCVERVTSKINSLGGLLSAEGTPRLIPKRAADGSYQLDFFSQTPDS